MSRTIHYLENVNKEDKLTFKYGKLVVTGLDVEGSGTFGVKMRDEYTQTEKI